MNNVKHQRTSPIVLPGQARRTKLRRGWRVVLEYEGEQANLHLVDLSHWPKWDIQASDLIEALPSEIPLPPEIGVTVITPSFVINYLNPTQVSLWQWHKDRIEFMSPAYTDTTEAFGLLGLAGSSLQPLLEKLTRLDLWGPAEYSQRVFQGPVGHINCQVVLLKQYQMVMLACARGYAQDLADMILDAGKGLGIRPGGEDVIRNVFSEE